MKHPATLPSVFFYFFFLLFTSSSVQVQSQVSKSAKDLSKVIQLTNTDYNMGRIVSGKPVEYNITVKNISNDTVSLQRVQAGCGCTNPKYAAGQVLKPGDITMITLGFDGKTTGPFTKFADIYFGNGQSTKVKFTGEAIKQ